MSFKRPYKLIIFDWDGTLMDSEIQPIPTAEQIKNSIGLGLQDQTPTPFFPGVEQGLRVPHDFR